MHISIETLNYTPNGDLLIGSDSTGKIRLWDASQGRLLHTLHEHKGAISQLDCSPDGRFLLSGDLLGDAFLWDLASHEVAKCLIVDGAAIYGAKFSPNGRYAAICEGHNVKVWDTQNWQMINVFGDYPEPEIICFEPLENTLIIGDRCGALERRDVKTGTHIQKSDHDLPSQLIHVTVSHDGSSAYIWDSFRVFQWDLHTNDLREVVSAEGNNAMCPGDFADRRLLYAEDNGTICVYDVGENSSVYRHTTNAGFMPRIIFSHDHQHAVTGGDDNTLRLWSITTGAEIRRFEP